MAAIDTKLNVDTSIKSIGEAPAVRVSGERVDRNRFKTLADALKDFNPALKQFVVDKEEEKADKLTLEGANAINGMTLEEAKAAHKAGFPDIQNPWARYGAYKQYANNAADNFVFEAQKNYNANKGNKDYNWETDYAERFSTFTEGKDEDAYFMASANNANQTYRAWVNSQEVERQSAFLTSNVKTNTQYELSNIASKVITRLDVDFLENYASPYDFDDGNYKLEKLKFYRENFKNYWFEELEGIKQNLNPALSLSDLDGLIIKAAKEHIKTDGSYASLWREMLTEGRPDGTPAIIDNPKYTDQVLALIDGDIRKAENVNIFTQKFIAKNVSGYSNEEFNKLSQGMFEQTVNRYKAAGQSDGQALVSAVIELSPYLDQRPIKAISDILNRPIGREPTPDNIAAFNVAMVLAQQGKLGNFFTENNKKNRALWSIAIRKFNSGNQQPEDILKELGRYTANYKFATLNTDDKNALKSLANSKDVEYNQRNRAIYNDIASWYKSISPEDEWEANTKQYIEDHYEVYNGNLYSKNKMRLLGIPIDNMELAKEVIVETLRVKLKNNTDIIENDLDLFEDDVKTEENINKKKSRYEMKHGNAKTKIDKELKYGNYEIIINSDDGTVGIAQKSGLETYQLPSTYTTKDKEVRMLEITLEELADGIARKQKVLADNEFVRVKVEAEKEKLKKEKTIQENKETEELIDLSGLQEGMEVKEETPTDTKSKLPLDVNILKTTSAKGAKGRKERRDKKNK